MEDIKLEYFKDMQKRWGGHYVTMVDKKDLDTLINAVSDHKAVVETMQNKIDELEKKIKLRPSTMATKSEIRTKRQEIVDNCNEKYPKGSEVGAYNEYSSLTSAIETLGWVLYSHSDKNIATMDSKGD